MAGTLTSLFRQAVSKHKDHRMKEEATANVAYPTGFLNFDFANGTIVHVQDNDKDFKYCSVGIQDGCLVTIIGRSGCGKTTWTVQAAANIVRPFPNGTIFHDDIEGGINAYRREQLTGFSSEEMESKYIIRNSGITLENFYERIKIIHDLKMNNRADYEYDTGLFDSNGNRIFKLQPTVYIIDSIALLMPAQYTEEEELSGSMSATAAAKGNSLAFKRIIPMLKSANIIIMAINHINQNIDINPMQKKKAQVSYLKQSETLPGGNFLIYATNILIRLDDNTKLKPDEAFGIYGNFVDMTLIKSRNSRANNTCTLVFDQNSGFDPDLSLFLMLKEAKVISGAGAYLYLPSLPEIKFSQKNFKQKLNENPELKQAFIEFAMNMLKSTLTESTQNKHVQDYSVTNDILSQLSIDI